MADFAERNEKLADMLNDLGWPVGNDPEQALRKLVEDMRHVVVSRTDSVSDGQLRAIKACHRPIRDQSPEEIRHALAHGDLMLAANHSLYAALMGESLRQTGFQVALMPLSEAEKEEWFQWYLQQAQAD